RHLFRHHRRPGLRLPRLRQHLESPRPRPPRRAFGRGPDAALIQRQCFERRTSIWELEDRSFLGHWCVDMGHCGFPALAKMVRILLPYHLRNLARITGEIQLEIPPPVTIAAVLAALESRYPMLRGAIRDHSTLKRRPFIRYFACKEDLSLEPPETILP